MIQNQKIAIWSVTEAVFVRTRKLGTTISATRNQSITIWRLSEVVAVQIYQHIRSTMQWSISMKKLTKWPIIYFKPCHGGEILKIQGMIQGKGFIEIDKYVMAVMIHTFENVQLQYESLTRLLIG